MRIVVEGAGIVGSTVTRVARARGHDVTLVDPHPERAASRAALAVIREAWHPRAKRDEIRFAVDYWAAGGWRRAAGAVVTTWRRGEERQERDWHLVDPIGPLVEPDTDSAPEGPADVTVRAVGTETEGAGGQWGHTAIGRGRAAGPLQVYRIAPYRDLAVGQVSDDEIRCGSSTGKDETSSRRQMETRLAMAVERGMVPEGIEWRIVGARRPWPQGTTEGEVRWRGRTATVEPTGKVGYALAPGIAFRIVRRAETLNRA